MQIGIAEVVVTQRGMQFSKANIDQCDTVLVVEDDMDIATLIEVNLVELGLDIEHIPDGKAACEAALKNDYCLILLDVMLPSMNGLDICRTVRNQKPEQAILMLTAKNSETDRVLGLELGADDYLPKPFGLEALANLLAQHTKAA